jgi:hypothetical protein
VVHATTAADVARRAEADALAKRYQDAADQLGHQRATVRMAGVYAMARLADDWKSERQTCIDVLCAYLRMPPQGTPGSPDFLADREVRASVARVIASRVREEALDRSWRSNDFDFTGALLHDFRMEELRFEGTITFTGATFSGATSISDCYFRLGVSFRACIVTNGTTFIGRVGHSQLRVGSEDCRINLTECQVDESGILDLWCLGLCEGDYTRHELLWRSDSDVWSAVRIDLTDLDVRGGVTLFLSTSSKGYVHMGGIHIESGANLELLAMGQPDDRFPDGMTTTWIVDSGANIYLSKVLAGRPSWQFSDDVRGRAAVVEYDPFTRGPRPWRNDRMEMWRFL